jgi:hypothetical protein
MVYVLFPKTYAVSEGYTAFPSPFTYSEAFGKYTKRMKVNHQYHHHI